MNLKNCIIVFRNRKNNDFKSYNGILSYFFSENIYFYKLTYCAFDDSEEIIRCLKDCKDNYDNVIIYCPASMEETVKDFTEKLFGGKYDSFGIMQTDKTALYILGSDGAGKLTEREIADILKSKSGQNTGKAYIKTVGASSEEINAAIAEAKSLCGECEFNVDGNFSNCSIEMIYPANLPKYTFDNVYRAVLKGLNDYVYAMENISLAERLYQLLKLRRMKISVAESFTGGGISKKLVEVSGISEVYFEGLNTYSNEAKINRLGVKELTLKQFGAVSEETAFEMAEGLLKTGNCDIAIATTGIAGPKSDMTAKPVGLIYIGVGTAESVSVYKYELKGNREQITETAVNLALFLAFKKIK